MELKRIAIFGSFLANRQSVEYRMADELGYRLSARGFNLMCGGHGGIAEALVAGATRGGGEVTGISLSEAEYHDRAAPVVPCIVETVQAATVAERLACFARADGFVFFSGGIGSLAEFAFVWHSLQLEMAFDRPVVLLSRSWKRVLAEVRREQMVRYKYFQYLFLCDDVQEAVAILTGDYSLKYGTGGARYNKECVLFDLDGTIVESPEETFMEACEDAGHFFAKQEVIAAFGKAGRLPETEVDSLPYHIRVLEELGIERTAATGIAERMSGGDARPLECYPDAVETVNGCRERGLTVGAVSARHPTQLERLLSTPPLAGLFDFVVAADHTELAGEEELLGRALEISGISPERLLYVGDSFGKRHIAPAVGSIDAVLLDRHLHHILDDAATTIRSLRELGFLVKPAVSPSHSGTK